MNSKRISYGYGNWIKGEAVGSESQQQQRLYFSASQSKSQGIAAAAAAAAAAGGNGAKMNDVKTVAPESVDYQNYFLEQQQQYSGIENNTAVYGYSSGFFINHPASIQRNIPLSSFRRPQCCTFPRKTYFGHKFVSSQSPPNKKRKLYTTAGKSAAMILNELYPEFKDQCNYKTVMVDKLPRFECSISIQSKTYCAEGLNKKTAKQLACERALKDLRPDIKLDVTVAVTEAKKLANYGLFAPQAAGAEVSKADEYTSCNSLHDYFLRLCREKERSSNQKFTPQFMFTDLASTDNDNKSIKKIRCTLYLPHQDKSYTHEGYGKAPVKNAVIREALIDLFSVPQEQLKMVERRAMNLKPGKPSQVLTQALSFYDRSMKVDVNTVDGKPAQGNSQFICCITLDNNRTITGTAEDNKQKAKDSACERVLIEELGLTMPYEDLSLKRAAAVLSPPYALHQLMIKQNRKKAPDLVYDEPQDISEAPNKPSQFRCILTVNGSEKFEGIGLSKKAARSAAAEKALIKIFKFDLCSENALELLTMKKSKNEENVNFCSDICSFVRSEYEGICQQQACPITTHISAFVLVAPDGEKQMVALGAGRNAVIGGHYLVNARGNVLVHMQSSVLARRAFLLYLHNQIINGATENSVVERCPDSNKYRLKPGYQVVLYASFPPNLRVSGDVQCLSCYMGKSVPSLTPARLQTIGEMINTGRVHVMSLADKMLKWNYLGLQGALLSQIMESIFITHFCIGTPSNDRAIANAVLLRFGDARKDELMIKSSQTGVVPHGEIYHNWVAGNGLVERLDPFTGRTVTGSPSRLCKSELFESWARVMATVNTIEYKPSWSCAEAKQNGEIYQQDLQRFHSELRENGLGMWQRKDPRIDDFQSHGPSCQQQLVITHYQVLPDGNQNTARQISEKWNKFIVEAIGKTTGYLQKANRLESLCSEAYDHAQ